MKKEKHQNSLKERILQFLDKKKIEDFIDIKELKIDIKKRPKNLTDYYVYNIVPNEKLKNRRFYNKNNGTVLKLSKENLRILELCELDWYTDYNFSRWYTLKSLSNTSFKLIDKMNDCVDGCIEDLPILFLKLNDMGIEKFSISFYIPYKIYPGDSEDDTDGEVDEAYWYHQDEYDDDRFFKIKFDNPADAAMFSFTFHSTKVNDDED